MKPQALLFGLLCLAPWLVGQDIEPDTEPLRPPALLVRPALDAPSQPLSVHSAALRLEILGQLARAELDLTFKNDTDSILEGQLVLPLPSGATVSAFALEIEGVLREAAVVEREKARVVFEEIVRRGVDPGLVEWVQGNVFQTRVYPIPARGTKRCVLAYEWEVGERLTLPVRFGNQLASLSVDVTAAAGVTPQVESAPCAGETATTDDGTFTAHYQAENIAAEQDLVLRMPGISKPRVAVQSSSQGNFFYASMRVPVPEAQTQAPPERLTLLFDASASRELKAREQEIELLRAWFAAISPKAVRLVVFSNAVWFEEDFDAASLDQLFERMSGLRTDGGTRLSCLDLARYDDSDALVLCSDGLNTLGDGMPASGAKPVHVIVSGARQDRGRLEQIAARGQLLDLNQQDPAACLEALSRLPVAFMGLRGEGISDVSPAAPSRAAGVFSVAGRLQGEPNQIEAIFVDGMGRTWSFPLELPAASTEQSGLLARAWARKRVAELAPFPERELEVKQLGLKFGIVTPQTSLLVLETLADYIRYRIVPPPVWQDAYFEQIEAAAKLEEDSRIQRLAELRALWTARLAWWNQNFEYADDFRFAQPSEDGANGDLGGAGGGGAFGDAEPPATASPQPRRTRAADAPIEESLALSESDARGDREEAKMEGEAENGFSVELKPWTPDMPYMAALQEAGDGAWEVYLRLRPEYGNSSAFYLDVSDVFADRGETDRALRVLSNVAELDLGSAPLLRILAHRLAQLERPDLAAEIFREVLRLRPEEPQSHRDLALVLEKLAAYSEAISLLETVVMGSWDGRFPEIQVLALGELNRCIALCREATGSSPHVIPEEFVKVLDVDLRVILTWDADQCDMDLWVVEPSGEKAFYSHTRTAIGGWFGRDFTGGYGPEEYLLKKAMPGSYKIQVNYYGNRQQMLAGATTIQLTLVKNYGRPNEERVAVTRRLRDVQQVLDIAELRFP